MRIRSFLMAPLVAVASVFLFSGSAQAAADMAVDLTGPSQGVVQATLSYNLNVRNLGNSKSNNVVATVAFPQGTQVLSVSSPCTVQSTQVRCAYSSWSAGYVRNIGLVLRAPSVAGNLTLNAAVTGSGDQNASNNQDSLTTQILAANPPIVISPPQDIHVSQCAGSQPLVYAQCTPGSLIENDFTLEANGVANFYEPGYAGSWSQPSSNQIVMTAENTIQGFTEAIYSGVSVSSTCFEGTVYYPPNPNWYSAFRICLQ